MHAQTQAHSHLDAHGICTACGGWDREDCRYCALPRGATVLSHLRPYQRPSHFADWAAVDRTRLYPVCGIHRDSDALACSNYRVILRAVGGESATVHVLRDSHCLVGWVETIYLDPADVHACEVADGILRALDAYPIADEMDYSELEYERAAGYWETLSVRERADWCRRYHVSVFAARRAEIPEDLTGALISALAE